jgi:hypothetical protein
MRKSLEHIRTSLYIQHGRSISWGVYGASNSGKEGSSHSRYIPTTTARPARIYWHTHTDLSVDTKITSSARIPQVCNARPKDGANKLTDKIRPYRMHSSDVSKTNFALCYQTLGHLLYNSADMITAVINYFSGKILRSLSIQSPVQTDRDPRHLTTYRPPSTTCYRVKLTPWL